MDDQRTVSLPNLKESLKGNHLPCVFCISQKEDCKLVLMTMSSGKSSPSIAAPESCKNGGYTKYAIKRIYNMTIKDKNPTRTVW